MSLNATPPPTHAHKEMDTINTTIIFLQIFIDFYIFIICLSLGSFKHVHAYKQNETLGTFKMPKMQRKKQKTSRRGQNTT